MAKAKSGENTVATVEALVRPVVEELHLTLWDVRFEKEGPDWYLRVLVDNPAGQMDTDTCAQVSHAIDPLLDSADPIDQSYFLEVGSPGLGRKLTRPEHFEACKGQKVTVRLIRPDETGCREYTGLLLGREGAQVRIETAQGTVCFDFTAASFVKLDDDEDLFD